MGSKKSIIGCIDTKCTINTDVDYKTTHKGNTEFWDTVGSEVLGVTALPSYGGFITEENLQLFGDLSNKKVLEIGCGNGHSLEYIHSKGASELWGTDISSQQIERSKIFLESRNIKANFICSPMESSENIPKDYFDIVYAVYSIGWTTDLNKTLKNIASYLKENGVLIFSWSHPIHKCVSLENDKFIFCNSYFDEGWYSTVLAGKEFTLSNRKLSTYINALAKNGFAIEKLIEDNCEDILNLSGNSDFVTKAKMLPVTFVIKARKF